MRDIQTLYEKIKTAGPASLAMSMGDVHAKGLFSLVFHGQLAGQLTRAYLAEKKVSPFDAQLHSHSYDLKITVLRGRVTHHTATMLETSAQGAIEMPTYKYKSALNGGDGVLRYVDERSILIDEYVIPPAATLYLKHSDVHTVSCSKGAIWVVEELGFRANETTVLGSPFCVDDLYRKPKQFEINNAYQKLRRTAQALIDDHALAA
ncbi:hypothetical protein N9M10_04470 [Hellea sp.]|nr:hypothetical protein [Hellea sp.]